MASFGRFSLALSNYTVLGWFLVVASWRLSCLEVESEMAPQLHVRFSGRGLLLGLHVQKMLLP
jgi:hypothetical protein